MKVIINRWTHSQERKDKTLEEETCKEIIPRHQIYLHEDYLWLSVRIQAA